MPVTVEQFQENFIPCKFWYAFFKFKFFEIVFLKQEFFKNRLDFVFFNYLPPTSQPLSKLNFSLSFPIKSLFFLVIMLLDCSVANSAEFFKYEISTVISKQQSSLYVMAGIPCLTYIFNNINKNINKNNKSAILANTGRLVQICLIINLSSSS